MTKTCLIMGNGPSLASIPNNFLSQYTTFGGNRCYLKFVPDYYAWIDPHNLRAYAQEINQLDCKKFIVRHLSHLIKGAVPLINNPHEKFSYDPFQWIHGGHTVTYVLLQLAYYFDFEKVGLIGVDHKYVEPKDGRDPNHFTSAYYGINDTWWLPDLTKVEESYRIAKSIFENNGREIVNITSNSALEIFPKENWENWRV